MIFRLVPNVIILLSYKLSHITLIKDYLLIENKMSSF